MLGNPVTFRRTAAGILLVLAPLLQAVAVVVDPGTWGDDREAVSFGDNPALAQLQSVLYHWSWILMALAALGLVHLTRRKATAFGHVTGALTVVGYISASALLMSDPVEWWLGQRYQPEESQRIMEEMLGLPGVIWGFQLPWLLFGTLGLPLLTAAVWRAGFVGWWVPALVAERVRAVLPGAVRTADSGLLGPARHRPRLDRAEDPAHGRRGMGRVLSGGRAGRRLRPGDLRGEGRRRWSAAMAALVRGRGSAAGASALPAPGSQDLREAPPRVPRTLTPARPVESVQEYAERTPQAHAFTESEDDTGGSMCTRAEPMSK
ncbi:hypothetical protein ACFSTC_14650 [Nonomuraea ferruginea]